MYSLIASSQLNAQTIVIDSTFSSDGEIFPFSQNDTIYGLSISGSVDLFSDTSLVRVILSDTSGNEWMVYEAYYLILPCGYMQFEGAADETKFLQVNTPYSLEIQIIAASFELDTIHLESSSQENIETLQEDFKEMVESRKVDSMNLFIEEHQMIWFAGRNPVSDRSFADKATMFGQKYNILGLDYYTGGIFDPYPFLPKVEDNSLFISNFDWREKHNAHLEDRPYFDGNSDLILVPCNPPNYQQFLEHGNGWMTKLKDQTPETLPNCTTYCNNCCYIFGSLASLEAVTNLYFNYHYDLDLSEQYALNCDCMLEGCASGSYLPVFLLAENEGIIDEASLPWVDHENTCQGMYPFVYKLIIEGHHGASDPTSEELKEMLLAHGPLSISIDFNYTPLNHIVSLVGYGTLQVGDTIHDEYGNVIIVGENYAGSLYWICKNSWGPYSGADGYFYFIHKSSAPEYYPIRGFLCVDFDLRDPITVVENNPFMDYERHCYDYDNDGYYNWGLGDMPEGLCDPPCDLREDCNDDNKRIGPCDDYYYGEQISPQMEVHLFKQLPAIDILIENNAIISFSDDELTNGILTFKIMNTGDALLHLENSESNEPVKILQGEEWFDIEQPYPEVCMGDEQEFEIHFTGNDYDMGVFRIDVHSMDEDVLSDLEFALVYNGCQTLEGTETITATTTWNDPYKAIHKDIRIAPQTTLTITGKVAFSPETDVIVDRGGRLILDSGQLTGMCNTLWNGIDLWGDHRLPQLEATQGVLEVRNGGTIEFSKCGVENGVYEGSAYTYTGGIMIIDDAVFKDNVIGVRFWPYHNYHPVNWNPLDNFSRFINAEFRTTPDLYELGFNPSFFVYMLEVEGINFLACDFTNELESYELGEEEEAGIGIFATEACFMVDQYCSVPEIPCPAYDPCRFENLEYGIKSSYMTPGIAPRINNSLFENNKTGIYIGATAFPEVNRNVFHVRKSEPGPFNETVYCGLYLDWCTGYQVEENFFYTFLDDSQKEDLLGVGIVVNNSGTDNNEIYNNTFDGLYAGIIAQEVNRNEEGDLGLQIKCNNLDNNIFDIAVTQTSSGNKGIAKDQGSDANDATAPASNQFTYIAPEQDPEPEGNYYNVCENITYWHHANTAGFNLIPTRHTPEPAIDLEPGNYNLPFDEEASCPSHLSGGGPGIEDEKTAMLVSGQQADSVQYLLELLIDGGSTEELLTEIQTSWPENGYELFSELISESPYLSDTSLIEAVGKEDVLLPGMVTDVLIANPQSAKSEDVMTAVDERDNPLTDDQMADIGEGRFIIGAKEALEMDYAFHAYQKDLSKNNLVRLYKADTLIDSPGDSIINILNFQPRLSEEYLKAFEFLKMGDSMNVFNTLDTIPGNYELTSAELLEHSLYQDYFDLLLSLDTASSKMLEMDSAQITLCHNILDNASGRLAAYVRNVLIINDSLNYNEIIIIPDPGLKSGKVRFWPVKKQTSENFMKIYPNPAKNVVIIETRLKVEPHDAFINTIDNKGIIFNSYPIRKQHEYLVIPITDFKSGILICRLIVRNKIVQASKLVIVR